MSWISWGLSSVNPQYEELVEKACSPLNLAGQPEDIALNLEICDMIRSKAVLPKPAMQSLKKRIATKNGRVQISALSLVDTCIKNGGDHFLMEIASKEFIDEMTSLIKATGVQPDVHNLALKLFQQWALAFESKPELSYFVDVYKELKASGIQFPPPPPALPSHLLTTSTAPTWVDSDTCMRCRTAFTFTNRKHHCRNCGQVFDQACSSKTMPIPRFGITQPVRVCEGCYIKSGAGVKAPAVPSNRTPRSRTDLDADLQRAIELSLAEAQPGGFVGSEPPLVARSGTQMEDDDEEFRLAIEASLRESERARPSAPNGLEEHEFKPLPTFDLNPRETETILTFSSVIDQATAYGERDLRRFPHAHDLYAQAYHIGGKLQRNVEEKGTKQQMLGEMQSKINEAVGLYGALLDRQREYAERQRYAAQPSYGYAPQQPYASYAAQPLQQQHYEATPAPPASSSMYPSLQQAQYVPQAYASQPQQYAQQPYPIQMQQQQQGPHQAYAPPESPVQAYQAAPPQQQQQHYPQQSYGVQSHPSAPSRQQSYQEAPSQPPVQSHQQAPQQVPVGYPESVQPYASAPAPAVDLSTHPTSPQRQTSSFPAFPSAPDNAFVEPVREEPKEALLIEL